MRELSIVRELTSPRVGNPRVGVSASCPVTSPPMTLLSEPPLIPDDRPGNVSVVQNGRVTLPCPAEGTPAPRISWHKDGRPLSATDARVRLLADGALQIDHAELADAGQYTCHAQNVAGNTSKDFDLQVFCKFSLIMGLQQQRRQQQQQQQHGDDLYAVSC